MTIDQLIQAARRARSNMPKGRAKFGDLCCTVTLRSNGRLHTTFYAGHVRITRAKAESYFPN